jgi:hypothetical protein
MASTLASEVARRSESHFLEHGNFVFAGPMTHGGSFIDVAPASAGTTAAPYLEESGFAGLAVQSVGYDEGGNDDPVVHIYVTRGSRSAEREIEVQNEPVRVRIERVGKVTVRPETARAVSARGNLYIHNDRVACGSSCAPSSEQIAGTFGALIQKVGAVGANRPFFALSNNHVFAGGNHTPINVPILAPANMDAGPNLPAPKEICRHSEICELRSGDPAFVSPVSEDIAIARIVNPAFVSSWQGDDENGFDTPNSLIAPTTGMRVKKFGRTSGLTFGIIAAAVLPFPLPYVCKQFKATVWVRGAWTIRTESPGEPFAIAGDSGSLVTDEAAEKAIGVIFAATPSGDLGYMIPMTHVATLLGGLRLVRAHGV